MKLLCRRASLPAVTLFVTLTVAFAGAQAPAKKALSVEDYTQWRTINGAQVSGDGKWVSYVLQLTNTPPAEAKPVLHLLNLETNKEVTVANAVGAAFSADSRWLAYGVDPNPGRGRGRGQGQGQGAGGAGGAAGAAGAVPGAGAGAGAGAGGAGAGAPDTAVPPGSPTAPQPAPVVTPAQPATPPTGTQPGAPAQAPTAPAPAPGAPAPAPGAPAPAPGAPAPAPGTAPAQAPAPGTAPSAPSAPAAPSAPSVSPRRVELRNLETGAVSAWQDIDSFVFSPLSTHLVLKRRPATPGGGGEGRGGGSAPAETPGGGAGANATPAQQGTRPRGTDVIVVDLKTGRHQLLGSVGDIAFSKKGDLLAYTVDASVKDANGLFVINTRTGRLVTLDSDARFYNRMTWDEGGTALAVLKGIDVEKMRERDNILVAYPDVLAAMDDEGGAPSPIVFERAKAADFPKGWIISDRAPLTWSDDRKRVFFGIKEQVPAPATGERRTTDEAADVDVWNTADERVQSQQMVRAEQDRNFTFRQAFDVTASRFVKLADETMRELEVADDGRWAVGRDIRGYVHDHKRAAADIYRVNTTTGERTLMLKNQMTNTSTGSHVFGITPDGKHYVYWRDNKYHAYDLDAGAARPLGNGAAVNFIDAEFDHPGPRPSYGIAGYTHDGKAAIAQHRYDLWLLPLDGSAPRNLTNGAGSKNEVRLRYVRTEPEDPPLTPVAVPTIGGGGGGPQGGGGGGRGAAQRDRTIDLTRPLLVSAYGEWTKKAGFYELANGQLKELVYEDAAFGNVAKAAKADTYLFTRQTFVEFPDLRVSGPDFKNAKKITNANPQQPNFVWGRRLLFDYKNKDGVRLQGILTIPDDYKPGERRPMIVTFYEKNSQNMHRYNAPSYLTGMGASPMEAVSRGYLTMLPDVHFRTGSSHTDMLECVEAATKKVIELGYADPRRIGVSGHSYGGEGAAFIGVMSKMFAAVAMGAGVTDLYNDFSQNWGWAYQYSGGSGATGHDYYLYGQGRWGVSPWDDPDRYRYESALTHAPKATVPFLIMHGTADPTVDFNNAVAFYNALRFHNKKAVLLAYPGEGHGLRGMANRKDLTIRYFQFFDHYLKDAPAPKWMTDGVPFIKKDQEKLVGGERESR